MELKKSYKGFIAWMVLFIIASIGVCFLPIEDTEMMTRIVLNICTFAIVLLAFIIYKTEYVYWYNGTTYETAVQAGSERRKLFAMRHLQRFGICALVFLVCSIIFQVLQLSIWTDTILVTVGLVATAVSTITIKL